MKEEDIRPQEILDRYLELSRQDAVRCFADSKREAIPCVGCGSSIIQEQFEKQGFCYGQCQDCGTLFQTPRPSPKSFEAFYQNSESSNYWAEVFFPAVAEARREKIFRPRVERLIQHCESHGHKVNRLIDVGAGFGIFLDEWRRADPECHLVAVEPSASLAGECRAKGFDVVESIAEQVGAEYRDFADMVVCFEVLEHTYEPLDFLNSLCRLVKPGGMVFISTLCIDGFDLQTLWDQSSQIYPPSHINFLSVRGFQKLFQRVGLVDLNISTPGKLDVDIVRNALQKNPELLKDNRFLQHVIVDENKANIFQKFLAENQLSSHAWVSGKKAE